MTVEDSSPQSPVYQSLSPYREAVEDMSERARRLEERNADWLRAFERKYGVKTR